MNAESTQSLEKVITKNTWKMRRCHRRSEIMYQNLSHLNSTRRLLKRVTSSQAHMGCGESESIHMDTPCLCAALCNFLPPPFMKH